MPSVDFLDVAPKIADEFEPIALTNRSLGTAISLDTTSFYCYFSSTDFLFGTLRLRARSSRCRMR